MELYERLLMECRYLLSLNKTYSELSKILKVDKNIIISDLNNELPKYDNILNQRVQKVLKKINN